MTVGIIQTSLYSVLNLVISGIPSILTIVISFKGSKESFKPCYKWNTFNTNIVAIDAQMLSSFKPCYKWNTFNTKNRRSDIQDKIQVLNLVISGIPSIQKAIEIARKNNQLF